MRARYLLGFLVGIGLIILVLILIVKSIIGPSQTPAKPLLDYAGTNAVVKMTIDGPEVSNQNHQSVQIVVNQYQSEINIISGYQGSVVSSKSYTNNQAAYAVFLRALDLAGYSKGNTNPSATDYRGFCPFGDRYIYELSDHGSDIEYFWSTSCGGQGTFGGNVATVNALFADQIPDYNTLTNNVQF